MPAQSQQQTPARSTEAPVAATGGTQIAGQSMYGNAFLQDQLKAKQSPGKLSWQAALGESIGGKLYDALAPQLTDEKLGAHARKAVDSAIAALKKGLEGQVAPSEQDAANLFLAEIDKQLKQIATDAVVASGLSEGIRDTVDAHPYEIALAAAAGAVAYVLSNQDLPLFETKLGLGGGHSLVGGIDPGRTLSLALEQVRVGYRYQGDHLVAHLEADKFQNGWGASGGVQYTPTPGTQMSLEGSHSERDGTKNTKLDLRYVNPDVVGTMGWQRNEIGGRSTDSVGASLSSRGGPDELQRSLSGTWRSDGSWEAAAGIGKSDKNSSWSVEAFGGRDAAGNEDKGIRALYKLRF